MSLYLTTRDPEVIAVIERNDSSYPAFRERAFAWAAERGSEELFLNRWLGKTYVTGIKGQPVGFGRWTKPDHNGCSKPFANNAAERSAMSALTHRREPVPGLPSELRSVETRDGTSYLMWPLPFVVGGVAFVGYSHQPAPGQVDKIGPQWAECLASKYYAADEIRRGVA